MSEVRGQKQNLAAIQRPLLKRRVEGYALRVATLIEIEKLALNLSEKERASLAANLLESLPGVLLDDDEGVAESLRRNADIEANPDQGISLAQLDAHIKSRRR